MKKMLMVLLILGIFLIPVTSFAICKIRIINNSSEDQTYWFITETSNNKVQLLWFFVDARQDEWTEAVCGQTYWFIGSSFAKQDGEFGCVDEESFLRICVDKVNKQFVKGDWKKNKQSGTPQDGTTQNVLTITTER